MHKNKYSDYKELTEIYGTPNNSDILKFNEKLLRKNPDNEKDEDYLESFCANIACYIAGILLKEQEANINGIYSLHSPKGEAHIGDEIFNIFDVNNLTTEEPSGFSLFITLVLTDEILKKIGDDISKYNYIIEVFGKEKVMNIIGQ